MGSLEPYETGERGSGDPSRWQSERELEWISLRPELVVEVTFDHASGGRIRHGTKILRWRDDKPPVECRLEQMTVLTTTGRQPMPLQGEYAPSSAEWVRNQVEEIESSGGTQGTVMRGVPVIVVTSMGHGSGKLRKNPVMRVEHDGKYAAVASKGGAPEHPAWYRNLVDHPLVEVQDATAKGDFTARELSGDERAQWWERAVAVWPDYAEYQKNTDREIPVFVLEPVS